MAASPNDPFCVSSIDSPAVRQTLRMKRTARVLAAVEQPAVHKSGACAGKEKVEEENTAQAAGMRRTDSEDLGVLQGELQPDVGVLQGAPAHERAGLEDKGQGGRSGLQIEASHEEELAQSTPHSICSHNRISHQCSHCKHAKMESEPIIIDSDSEDVVGEGSGGVVEGRCEMRGRGLGKRRLNVSRNEVVDMTLDDSDDDEPPAKPKETKQSANKTPHSDDDDDDDAKTKDRQGDEVCDTTADAEC